MISRIESGLMMGIINCMYTVKYQDGLHLV